MSPAPPTETLHASAVALGSKGLLITGCSGAGKSSLALELMARGATLVADDGVMIRAEGPDTLMLRAPDTIAGRIEARGLGLIAVPHTSAIAQAVVTLDEIETDRLPAAHEIVLGGVTLPLLRKVESPAFPAMLIAYLTGERIEP